MEATFQRRDFSHKELREIEENPSAGFDKIRAVYPDVDLVVTALLGTELFIENMRDANVTLRRGQRLRARCGLILGFEVLGREVMEYFMCNNDWSIPFLTELALYDVDDAYTHSMDAQANLLFDLIFEVVMNYFPSTAKTVAVQMLENLPIDNADEDLYEALCEDITESIADCGKTVIH